MSSVFSDSVGYVWNCRVTWAAIRRSQAAGVDLTLVEQHLGEFYQCSPKLIDALWSVLEPAGKEGGVKTREEFEERVSGEVLEAARDALLEGLAAFFPRGRVILIRAAANDVEKQLQALYAQLPKTCTELPESSELTQTTTLCES